ncbi:hypothetical protein XHV734_4075 [Xanthomonas hortorum pv. vitians]|nr:hypothetical protein XHV734_4075 [Xanthomonas hortorum pv. vitians]
MARQRRMRVRAPDAASRLASLPERLSEEEDRSSAGSAVRSIRRQTGLNMPFANQKQSLTCRPTP